MRGSKVRKKGFRGFGKGWLSILFSSLSILFFPFTLVFRMVSSVYFFFRRCLVLVLRHFNFNWEMYVNFLIRAVVAPWFYWRKYERWKERVFWGRMVPNFKEYLREVLVPYLFKDLFVRIVKTRSLKPIYYDWNDKFLPVVAPVFSENYSFVVGLISFYFYKKTFGFWYSELRRKIKFRFMPWLKRKFAKFFAILRFIPRAIVLAYRKGFPFIYVYHWGRRLVYLRRWGDEFPLFFKLAGAVGRSFRAVKFGCIRFLWGDRVNDVLFHSLLGRFKFFSKFFDGYGLFSSSSRIGQLEKDGKVPSVEEEDHCYSIWYRKFLKHTDIGSLRRFDRRRKEGPFVVRKHARFLKFIHKTRVSADGKFKFALFMFSFDLLLFVIFFDWDLFWFSFLFVCGYFFYYLVRYGLGMDHQPFVRMQLHRLNGLVTSTLLSFFIFACFSIDGFIIRGAFFFAAFYFSYMSWALLKFSFDYVTHIHVYTDYRWTDEYDSCHVSGTVDEYLSQEATPQWLYFWTEDEEQMGGHVGEFHLVGDNEDEEELEEEDEEDELTDTMMQELRERKWWGRTTYSDALLSGDGLIRGRKCKVFEEINPFEPELRYSYVASWEGPLYYPEWEPITSQPRRQPRRPKFRGVDKLPVPKLIYRVEKKSFIFGAWELD